MSSLCWVEFLKQARQFVQLSDQFKDGWQLIEKDDQMGNVYLTIRKKVKVSLTDDCLKDDLDDLGMNTDVIASVAQDQQSNIKTESNVELFDVEYHVVYSISYQVPVLYLKGYKSDGKPLGLSDAWSIFRNPAGNAKGREEMLSTLTQTDHPILFTPFLSLHPCRTGELLAQMGPSGNSIITFISLVGPFVGLSLRNEYGLAFQTK